MTVSKGWGAESAARAANTARKTKLATKKKPVPTDAQQEHYLRAWRKFTNLQERSNSGKKISPMRSRSFAPLENQLPGYGGRTGSNWEFNGNKRVRKDLISKKEMSDAALRRSKKAQSKLSLTSGGLGIASLGALAARKPDLASKIGVGSVGVGGIGSFNFARIQAAEAKKRGPKQNVYVVRNKKQIKNIKTGLESVKKEAGGHMDFGLSGVHQGTAVEIIEKSASYNPEERRHKRLDRTATSLTVGAGAAGAGAAVQGVRAIGKPAKYNSKGGIQRGATGLRSKKVGEWGGLTGKGATGFKAGARSAAGAAALGVTAVGMKVGSDRIKAFQQKSGRPYRPLYRPVSGS